MSEQTPRQIVDELDKYIVGQNNAKRAVAVALRNSLGDTHIDYSDAYELQSAFMNPYALVALGWVLVLALGILAHGLCSSEGSVSPPACGGSTSCRSS